MEEPVLIEHDAELYNWTILSIGDTETDTSNTTSGPLVSLGSSAFASMEDLSDLTAIGSGECPVQFQQLRALRRLAEDDAAMIELPGSEWGSEDENYVISAEVGAMWLLD